MHYLRLSTLSLASIKQCSHAKPILSFIIVAPKHEASVSSKIGSWFILFEYSHNLIFVVAEPQA